MDVVNTGAAGTPLTTGDTALLTVDVGTRTTSTTANLRQKFVVQPSSFVNWEFAQKNFRLEVADGLRQRRREAMRPSPHPHAHERLFSACCRTARLELVLKLERVYEPAPVHLERPLHRLAEQCEPSVCGKTKKQDRTRETIQDCSIDLRRRTACRRYRHGRRSQGRWLAVRWSRSSWRLDR